MGKRNQKKVVETVKSRKELRKNKRVQKKVNRVNYQKRRKELRTEYKQRLKNKAGNNKPNKKDLAAQHKDDGLADDEEMPRLDDTEQDVDNDDEDIASDFELSDEELEMKTKQMANNSKSKTTKSMGTKSTTQLEEDHQRLLKNEKDLRKQMNKQRIHQLKAANEDEDKNIKKLEKLLKINKTKGAKKIPKMFHDGLDYALEMCLPENIEKMYAAAKEAADAGDESNDDWQQDFAIATGQNNETGTANEKKNSATAEKKAAAAAAATAALNKKVQKLRKIEQKYFEDSDFDSDLSDVDSEFGELGKDDGSSDGDESNDSLNEDESDDEAPEEVHTKTSSSAKRRLEKEQNNALAPIKNGSKIPDEIEDDEEDEEMNDLSSESDGKESPDSQEDDDVSIGNDDEDTESDNGDKTAKKSNVWEDIYGRKRDKDGHVIDENEPTKYIPPHLRARMAQESSVGAEMDADPVRREKLLRLKRVLKGYINRLSEANMHKIISDIDSLYMQNSRHDMNETLTTLICDALISHVIAPERMVLEHALLIAALHANIGSEVGAHILQILINRFDALVRQGIEQLSVEDKTLDNVLLLLCHMYTFRIFKCNLIYEILERLSHNISEKSIECILLALKSIGFALRKDDPAKLKELILDLQKKSGGAPEEIKTNSRLKYMLDTLMAIKNNNVNKIPQYDPTVAEHLRKILKTLLVNGKYVTTLNISLEDLLSADARGKWWVVGSAWTGHINPSVGASDGKKRNSKEAQKFSNKLLELAKKQRMNTDDRRNVFCILMSSEDYVDAFEKLLQLAIKDHTVIISVIMHCCLAEQKFNPYYAVLGAKFCDYDRKYKLAQQFAIWDRIKDLSLYSHAQLENFSKFVLHLVTNAVLPISVLKVIEFGELDKPTLRFLRQLLLGILLGVENTCIEVFLRIAPNTKLKVFKDGLRLFMHHFLIKSGQKNGVSSDQLDLVKQRVQLVDKHLNTSLIQF